MTLMIKRNENVTRLSKPKVKPKKDAAKGEKSDSKRRSIKKISWAPTIEEMYVYDWLDNQPIATRPQKNFGILYLRIHSNTAQH